MSGSFGQNVFSYNHGSFNVTSNYTTVSDEESRIRSWISPLEWWKRHSDVARARSQGVGEWVLQSSKFRTWQQNGNDRSVGRILLGQGAPGAGKTFVCSLVVDALCDGTTGANSAVGCLYCDYRGQKDQTVEVMIGSLLRQFVTALPEIPKAIEQAFREAKLHLGGRAPELAKIIGLFPEVLERFQQVFICVDALDEFVAEHRARFLRSLRQILDKSPNTRLFLTARGHIQSELESNISLDLSIIIIQPPFSDIERYLLAKLDTDRHPGAMDDSLRSEILTKIPKGSSENFLIVTLQINSILGEITIGGRRKKLREMTSDLGDAFKVTLERIKGQHGALARFGISALMWISLAERPLRIDELCHALAVEVGSPNINAEMVPPIEAVVASCMGLVTIDNASSTVRLVHATLEEYLRNHQDNTFQNAHATIAEVCLGYLGIESVRDLASDLKTAPRAFPLLAYASCHWGAHARKEITTSVGDLALGILDQYPRHVAANIFLWNEETPWYPQSSSVGFSGLHYVAYVGIDELLEALLRLERVNLNQTDQWGRTPLILAARKGNKAVCKILLSRADVNPNTLDPDGQTPLFVASANGHDGVVRTLLGRPDVNPNSPDPDGRTPLFQASAGGHEGVVKVLLSHSDINPNSANLCGQTPLFAASGNGREGVVRILLSSADVNPNLADRYGQTPLFRASTYGQERVVRTLLSRADINPDSPTQHGQTPLHRASANGHEGVVRTLLSHANVNPNSEDQRGQTPLLRASENGHEGIVRILISRADVNPNSVNRFGQTPLSIAALNERHEIVTLLRTR